MRGRGCESKIKDGGIPGSRGPSSGIRRSIRVAADGSSASPLRLRRERGAPSAGGSDAESDAVALPLTSPVRVRRVPDLVLRVHRSRRQNGPRTALPIERGGDRPVVDGRHTLLRAVQSIGQEGSRFGRISSPALQIRCKGPVRPRSDSLRVAAQEQTSRAMGHSGAHESRWAKDSSMIQVDYRKMARLYLAVAACCFRIILL